MKKQNEYKTKTFISPDRIQRTIFDSKLHNWEGPAVIYPKEMKKKDEYYLYGLRKSKDEWKEAKRDWNGVSPEHNPQVKSR